MSKQKTILSIVILILVAGNAFFAVKYFSTQRELNQIKTVAEAKNTNEKVLNFTKFFIEEVLKSDSEVSFETRLKLENTVRDLGDDEILVQWQKFVESQTESQAQAEIKNLLEMLVCKISRD